MCAYRKHNHEKNLNKTCTCLIDHNTCESRSKCHVCVCHKSSVCFALYHKCSCIMNVKKCKLASKKHHCSCFNDSNLCISVCHKCICDVHSANAIDEKCNANNHKNKDVTTKRKKIED